MFVEWRCKISHSADWLQTLESIIQLQILEKGERTLSLLVPGSIKKLSINPGFHLKYCNEVDKAEAEYQRVLNYAKCGGIEMKDLKFQEIPVTASSLKFESIRFVPFMKLAFQVSITILWTHHRPFHNFSCFNGENVTAGRSDEKYVNLHSFTNFRLYFLRIFGHTSTTASVLLLITAGMLK